MIQKNKPINGERLLSVPSTFERKQEISKRRFSINYFKLFVLLNKIRDRVEKIGEKNENVLV